MWKRLIMNNLTCYACLTTESYRLPYCSANKFRPCLDCLQGFPRSDFHCLWDHSLFQTRLHYTSFFSCIMYLCNRQYEKGNKRMLHNQLTHSKQVEKHSDRATGICLRENTRSFECAQAQYKRQRGPGTDYVRPIAVVGL